MLDSFRFIVIFRCLCLKTSSAGDGRKSLITVNCLTGPSVYLVCFFIESPLFSPESGPKDSNSVFSVGKTDGDDAFAYPSDTEKPCFPGCAVRIIRTDDTMRIRKSVLGIFKGNPMFPPVLVFFFIIPFKDGHSIPFCMYKYTYFLIQLQEAARVQLPEFKP
jgi:hypothetical protein